MQIFAFDGKERISAPEALRKKSYSCPLCHGQLRVKKGVRRSPHFFHLARSRCSLAGKSKTHLAVQEKLLSRLLGAEMEKPFPTIQRIADIAWLEKKLVFEIQCSLISNEEIRNRERDYARLGLRVVWIFHIRKFSSKISYLVSPSPHLFTNIDEEGRGSFFDLCVVRGREIRLPLLIEEPLLREGSPPLHFRGDRFDRMRAERQEGGKKGSVWRRFLYSLLVKQAASEDDKEEFLQSDRLKF